MGHEQTMGDGRCADCRIDESIHYCTWPRCLEPPPQSILAELERVGTVLKIQGTELAWHALVDCGDRRVSFTGSPAEVSALCFFQNGELRLLQKDNPSIVRAASVEDAYEALMELDRLVESVRGNLVALTNQEGSQ